MNIQMRSEDNVSKLVEDLPSDYLTDSMFAIGVIQAADKRKPFYYIIIILLMFRNSKLA
jgi:hypothetical protein